MEQKKTKLTGRDLHAGDVVLSHGELHQIGTIGKTDAFDDRMVHVIHLEDAEPVPLNDAELMQRVGAKVNGNTVVIGGNGVSVQYSFVGGAVNVTINYDKRRHTEVMEVGRNAYLHVVQQMAWKYGRGELKIKIKNQKKQKKDE
mgnify:CR=1 FL=1